MDANPLSLIPRIRACTLCTDLPLESKPIVQFSPKASILIAGQAPGRITHEKGVPFDDPSGERLRAWMGISRRVFYDPQSLAIVPAGFCFPGTGKRADLPPRKICAPNWHPEILATLSALKLKLIIGQYAIKLHVKGGPNMSLTERVKTQSLKAETFILPHPSPRNNIWLKKNPWFETRTLPALKQRVAEALG